VQASISVEFLGPTDESTANLASKSTGQLADQSALSVTLESSTLNSSHHDHASQILLATACDSSYLITRANHKHRLEILRTPKFPIPPYSRHHRHRRLRCRSQLRWLLLLLRLLHRPPPAAVDGLPQDFRRRRCRRRRVVFVVVGGGVAAGEDYDEAIHGRRGDVGPPPARRLGGAPAARRRADPGRVLEGRGRGW
jgi:hypothetical protein